MHPARHRISPSTMSIHLARKTPLLSIRPGCSNLILTAEAATVGFIAPVLAEASVFAVAPVAAVEEVLDVGAHPWMLLLFLVCRVWLWESGVGSGCVVSELVV
jgi:hypothetical protein